MPIKILIVLTGGTFGSVLSEGRLVASDNPDIYAELKNVICTHFPAIDFSIVQPFSKLSENVDPNDWMKIFSVLNHNRDAYDAAIVVHGTDTMAYSAAAISYLNALYLRRPIVFTGANRPVMAAGTDAFVNLQQSITALLYFIGHSINDVFLVFNGSSDPSSSGRIHLGTRVKKEKWDGYCYKSYYVEKGALGYVADGVIVGFNHEKYESFRSELAYKGIDNLQFDAKSIFPVKLSPGLYPDLLPRSVNIFLLELYNSGTGPVGPSEFSLIPFIRSVTEGGGLVFCVSQHEGESGLSMDIYETSTALLDAGVIPLRDMIWESAIPKLMLCHNFIKRDDAIDFMTSNVSGEISRK